MFDQNNVNKGFDFNNVRCMLSNAKKMNNLEIFESDCVFLKLPKQMNNSDIIKFLENNFKEYFKLL